MDKEHIISEIQRTAEENDGKPLGSQRFENVTGIRRTEWFGVYWARWGDAVAEAGYARNTFNAAYSDEEVIGALISLVRELGYYPTLAEIRIRRKTDAEFPSHAVFNRVGRKSELIGMVVEYCSKRTGFEDILEICQPMKTETPSMIDEEGDEHKEFGFVYLFKSGRYYKIGRTSSVGRREYELSIQLPEKLSKVHSIKTDDPAGIEAYWHTRFASKRANGEWFDLDAGDVRAFKRRKFM